MNQSGILLHPENWQTNSNQLMQDVLLIRDMLSNQVVATMDDPTCLDFILAQIIVVLYTMDRMETHEQRSEFLRTLNNCGISLAKIACTDEEFNYFINGEANEKSKQDTPPKWFTNAMKDTSTEKSKEEDQHKQ